MPSKTRLTVVIGLVGLGWGCGVASDATVDSQLSQQIADAEQRLESCNLGSPNEVRACEAGCFLQTQQLFQKVDDLTCYHARFNHFLMMSNHIMASTFNPALREPAYPQSGYTALLEEQIEKACNDPSDDTEALAFAMHYGSYLASEDSQLCLRFCRSSQTHDQCGSDALLSELQSSHEVCLGYMQTRYLQRVAACGLFDGADTTKAAMDGSVLNWPDLPRDLGAFLFRASRASLELAQPQGEDDFGLTKHRLDQALHLLGLAALVISEASDEVASEREEMISQCKAVEAETFRWEARLCAQK